MQLIVLAAGHGRRFGGLKQLAPVGPSGEALMDYTAEDALAAGFDSVVLIVREEVRAELMDHISSFWPSELAVEAVVQGPVAGTAQAVASAGPVVDGAFGVVNADDLYGTEAIGLLGKELGALADSTHLIVGYRLAETVLTDAPVTRGICECSPAGELVRIVEQSVQRQDGAFSARPIHAPAEAEDHLLTGGETVSMNLWGFDRSIFAALDEAIEAFDPATAPHQPGKPPELLLPSVVGDLVTAGRARVLVEQVAGRCIGLTHPDDLEMVRAIVARERHLASG